MDEKNPFGYPIEQYIRVIVVACIAGLIKHLNSRKKKWSWAKLGIDLLTAGFMGVLTFWLLESVPVRGPLAAVLIATGGLMGNKAIKEFETMYRSRFGNLNPVIEEEQEQGELK